jgi:hypothetical protein
MGPQGDWNGAPIILVPCNDWRTNHVQEGDVIRFTGTSNRCLDLPEGQAWAGRHLQVWDCDWNNQDQRWKYTGSGGMTWTTAPKRAEHLCLDSKDGGRWFGNPINLWYCDVTTTTSGGASSSPQEVLSPRICRAYI